MKKYCVPSILVLLCTLSLSLSVAAQDRAGRGMYFIGFTDKVDTTYTIDNPHAYLSEKALLRRTLHGAPITETDLPVTGAYVAGVKKTGVKLWLTSKWMNGVVVAADGPQQLVAVRDLPYVDTAYYVAPVQYGPRPPLTRWYPT